MLTVDCMGFLNAAANLFMFLNALFLCRKLSELSRDIWNGEKTSNSDVCLIAQFSIIMLRFSGAYQKI